MDLLLEPVAGIEPAHTVLQTVTLAIWLHWHYYKCAPKRNRTFISSLGEKRRIHWTIGAYH